MWHKGFLHASPLAVLGKVYYGAGPEKSALVCTFFSTRRWGPTPGDVLAEVLERIDPM